ncbi:MAG: PRC-barrel domain-containing protein [Nitrospirales bacterium]|nr:PRC-barrel domain-containing protein [Nitrospirales bacterium]
MYHFHPSSVFIVFILCLATFPSPSKAEDTLQGMYKASQLVGKPVNNLQGKPIGVIEEIVIETRGLVGYAVLSFGGFLGMGDKLFAVPWTSLAHSEDREYLILDIQPEQLANAPGFDKNKWPDMEDRQWRKSISEFYQILKP